MSFWTHSNFSCVQNDSLTSIFYVSLIKYGQYEDFIIDVLFVWI